MTIPPTATHIYWDEPIGNGYDFVAGKRYKIHRTENGVCIYAPDEIRLDNGEVTEDVALKAKFE